MNLKAPNRRSTTTKGCMAENTIDPKKEMPKHWDMGNCAMFMLTGEKRWATCTTFSGARLTP